jgi:hypothetical protein
MDGHSLSFVPARLARSFSSESQALPTDEETVPDVAFDRLFDAGDAPTYQPARPSSQGSSSAVLRKCSAVKLALHAFSTASLSRQASAVS